MVAADEQYIIGIDTGGTFTDVVAVTSKGEVFADKAPTTPKEFSQGVMDAVGELAKGMGMSPNDLLKRCLMFKHGTTVATNALINRVGSKTGLITTKGFEDTTLIMRAIGRVAGLSEDEIKHQAAATKPEPLVPRKLIKGVTERIDFRGNVVIPINVKEAREAIRSLVEDDKVEAIAVNFLFSFINPEHEKKIRQLLEEMYPKKDLYLSFASELTPVVREYARSNTVIINSFLGKTVDKYISGLNTKLANAGYAHPLLIMQANGGIVHKEEMSPVGTLSSGPAGGMLASKYMADILGHKNVITSDMGGTSFDVGLIVDGFWRYAREPVVERFHLSWPMIEIESIGAGGGTISKVDPASGRLMVGPSSAGADPGPVCYNMGGTDPTISDVNVVLGYLNPDYFWSGRRKLDKKAAEKAIREKIAVPLKMDVIEAAAGIYDIINAHMSDLIKKQVARAGHVPEEFVIYSFGGAGPLHAAAYGEEIGAQKVYIFPTSAVFSAFGVASADIVHTYTFSYRYAMPVEPDVINKRLNEIKKFLLEKLVREGVNPKDVEYRQTFYMRYRRQLNELDVPVPAKTYSAKDIQKIMADFDKRYEEVYGEGTAYREAGTELISITIDAVARAVKPIIKEFAAGGKSSKAALKGQRQVYFGGKTKKFVNTNLYDYRKLKPNNVVEGPAIIETPITTIVVPPEKVASVDKYGDVLIDVSEVKI